MRRSGLVDSRHRPTGHSARKRRVFALCFYLRPDSNRFPSVWSGRQFYGCHREPGRTWRTLTMGTALVRTPLCHVLCVMKVRPQDTSAVELPQPPPMAASEEILGRASPHTTVPIAWVENFHLFIFDGDWRTSAHASCGVFFHRQPVSFRQRGVTRHRRRLPACRRRDLICNGDDITALCHMTEELA